MEFIRKSTKKRNKEEYEHDEFRKSLREWDAKYNGPTMADDEDETLAGLELNPKEIVAVDNGLPSDWRAWLRSQLTDSNMPLEVPIEDSYLL